MPVASITEKDSPLRFNPIFLMLLLVLFSLPQAASKISSKRSAAPVTVPVTSNGELDTNVIHGVYVDGDFEKATAMIEQAIRERKLTGHGDSVFAFKHLGVMYAAKDETREKGKYYMLQLLIVEPTARIMDMYASDMIYMIFKNIKEEYDISREKLERAESQGLGAATPKKEEPAKPVQPAKPAEIRSKRDPRFYYWVGGAGVALAGLGVATYFLLEDEPAKNKKTYDVE
jgi:hypothetical protein